MRNYIFKMARFHSDLVYLSAGCNTSPHCVSWGTNNVVLFASEANIIVCDPQSLKSTNDEIQGFKASQSLRHHSEAVNCVRWIENLIEPTAPEFEFVSLSSDKTCVVWSLHRSGTKNDADSWKFSVVQQLELKVPLQVGRCVYLKEASVVGSSESPEALLSIAGIDGSVTIWTRQNKAGFELTDTISFGRGQVLDLDMTKLAGVDGLLLACGGDDGKIHLFGLSSVTFQSTKLAVLEGHEDWIRTLEFSAADVNGQVHMLSAGQDCTVRLWTVYDTDSYKVDSADLWSQVNSKKIKIPGSATDHLVVYDTLLFGHEGWIYGAHWAPSVILDGKCVQPLRILSASMDKTVVIWEPQDEFGGVWTDTSRVGEVGGNNLGFYGCQFSPDARCILSHSFSGSLHVWTRNEEGNSWRPSVVPGGHFGPVKDLTWDPRGQYVLSTSQDQSTRLHAAWRLDTKREEWHEIGRPQVHGYDLQCLAITGPFSFASGAEEKIVRLFQAPKNFLTNFSDLCKFDVSKEIMNSPDGASVPALGLSNQAIFEGEKEQRDQLERHPTDRYPENIFTPRKLSQPPSEEDLIQNTLWPETHKLYGHGYEISSLACNHACSLLASASRASRPEDAEIFLWHAGEADQQKFSWSLRERLPAHTLTVTQMAFSHDDRFLLSVSRDRTWAISRSTDLAAGRYEVCARSDRKNGHSRIVWACAWTPDGKYFATGSRDKTVCVHNIREEGDQIDVDLLHRLTFDEPISALDLTFYFGEEDRYLLVVGVEDGHLEVHSFHRSGTEEPIHVVTLTEKHNKTINRIRFQPFFGQTISQPSVQLATCGSDRAVKIFKISRF